LSITDTFNGFFNTLVTTFSNLGYPGIFLLMVMESATLPVPSEVVLPLGGYLVYQGRLEFWSVVAVATLGSLVGTVVDYSIGYYLGRPAVLRYGRIVRFSHERLETTERWFYRHGNSVVLLARFVPLLRTLIAFPAGIVRMDTRRFLAFSAVGILVWDIALVYVGVLAGQNSHEISTVLHAYFIPLGLAAIVIAAIVGYRSLRKRPN
jgi:membrane protein DedA with SNARE-associated domain